jgi:hypothetical protein
MLKGSDKNYDCDGREVRMSMNMKFGRGLYNQLSSPAPDLTQQDRTRRLPIITRQRNMAALFSEVIKIMDVFAAALRSERRSKIHRHAETQVMYPFYRHLA